MKVRTAKKTIEPQNRCNKNSWKAKWLMRFPYRFRIILF